MRRVAHPGFGCVLALARKRAATATTAMAYAVRPRPRTEAGRTCARISRSGAASLPHTAAGRTLSLPSVPAISDLPLHRSGPNRRFGPGRWAVVVVQSAGVLHGAIPAAPCSARRMTRNTRPGHDLKGPSRGEEDGGIGEVVVPSHRSGHPDRQQPRVTRRPSPSHRSGPYLRARLCLTPPAFLLAQQRAERDARQQ